MPEDKKMVPERDLIAVKERLKKAEDTISSLRKQHSEATLAAETYKRQLETSKVDLQDDDEMKEVRKYLLEHEENLVKKERELSDRETAALERERKSHAKELVSEYKGRGLELSEEELLNAEDMDGFVKDAHADFLAKENERLKANPSGPESVFDQGSGAVVKKEPKDMTDAEFTAYYSNLEKATLSKR